MSKKTKTKELPQIAKNFKRFKEERGISKSELVRLTGLDYHTLAKIEHGITPDPRINTVAKIANALGKKIEDLIA